MLTVITNDGNPIGNASDPLGQILNDADGEICRLLEPYSIGPFPWVNIGNRYVARDDNRFGDERLLFVVLPNRNDSARFGPMHVKNFVERKIAGQSIAVGMVNNGGYIYLDNPKRSEVTQFFFGEHTTILRRGHYKDWIKKNRRKNLE